MTSSHFEGPFAATNGIINIITCSNYAHFKEDTTSVDALLRPGRIAKQVQFSESYMLEDMFVMMLGTDNKKSERNFSDLLENRASQFADEKNEIVKAHATEFTSNWMACFSPETATKQSPACLFTNDDVKSYLGQYFCGEAGWGNQLPARQAKKLEDAIRPANIKECKQRLMERMRESAARAAKAEPRRLDDLLKEVKEKDESTTSAFFTSRLKQAEHKLQTLRELAPEAKEDAPVFARPYKLRTEKEIDIVKALAKAIEELRQGDSVTLEENADA